MQLTSLPIVCWPTILVIPFPAQGHVAPLMKLATKIAENGIEVTFVNTEFIHAKIIASMQGKAENSSSQMMLVSIPDGLDLQADEREDPHKLMIEDPQADTECSKSYARIVGWALEVAEAIVIARAAFVPFGPGSLALSLHIPKLLDAAIIDPNGFAVLNYGLISLSNEIPALNRNEYTWSFPTEPNIQKIFFGSTCATVQAFKISKWVLNNSVYELDSPACDLIPSVLPFGPLDLEQLEQLALGIESLHQPFLRVVRPDFMKISHCGWNSTMEGLSMGVPFLCWPSFADQHHNRNYICDVWKIGVQLLPDENGIITRQEIQIKVKALLKNDGIKENSLKLKEIARKILVEEKAETSSLMITVVSIPDRLEPHGADPNDFQKVRQSMLRVMPGSCLKNLVEKVSESNDCQQIMFVIVDVGVGWTMEVAERWESRELHSFSPVASYS
ncbi:UDP-glycosyltransferase 83A1 [Citrus sinensis]|uniref:UDP-glycosyltransferase 83A1 n=1 Tax=Citrus sinensis TaxID=2711 RepID=A0ACB8LWZ8_CITSI|nr:UDP-glycosyltransferase 83A1 [Citrus sinensis]